MVRIKLGVLASGRGSNFLAIQDAIERGELNAEIRVLISDRKNARALELAREHRIPALYIPYDKNNRRAFEEQASAVIEEKKSDLVILAGFMRILTPYLVNRFHGRILNIHPSLLPAFKGLNAQAQALEYGVRITGCTVHVVTEEMDKGPIISQRAVPVHDGDTVDTLSDRILEQEHMLYPEAIKRYAERMQAKTGEV